MAAVLAVLIALLGLSSYLLYRLIAAPTTKTAAGSKPASTAGLEWVRSIYGTSNLPKDSFAQTQAAVSAADGTIWVTDAKTDGLMHFTPDGRYLGVLRSAEASSPLVRPSRTAIGPDGLFYICETTQDTVRVLRPDGSDAGSFGVPQPVSVAVSADHIAVGAVAGFAILKKTGEPIKVVGSRGKGDDQFDYVHGIAFSADGKTIYATDSYNNRLSAYDTNGKRLWMIRTGAPTNSASITNNMLTTKETSDTVLKGADALQLPLGLTVDSAGRIVVIDMYDCALAVFEAKTGKFVGKYGDAGSEDGQFFYPVSVGYDPGRDWFTVADAMNARIEIVRIPGSSGAGVIPAVNRTLAGPLRACLLPLLLLLLAIIAAVVVRAMRRRRANDVNEAGAEDVRLPAGVAVEPAGGDDEPFGD